MQKIVDKEDLKGRIFTILFSLILVFMPIKIEYSTYCTILMTLVWIWSGDWRKLKNVLYGKRIYFVICSLFTLTLVACILYFDEPRIKQLEKSAAFVVFPMIISTSNWIKESTVVVFVKVFGYTMTILGIIALSKVLVYYIDHDYMPNLGNGPWVRNYISMHRPYYGMYAAFTIVSFVHFIQKKTEKVSIAVIAILVNLTVVLLISARLAIIFIGLFIGFMAIRLIIKKSIWYGILFLIVFFGPLLINYKYNSYFEERVETTIKSPERLVIWECAKKVISNKEFNYVFGYMSDYEFQQHLNLCTMEKSQKQLNTHNQYLGFLGAYGFFGVGVLLFVLFNLLIFANRHREMLFIYFLSLIFFQSITENILNRQWGIFFFAIFSSLFLRSIQQNNEQ